MIYARTIPVPPGIQSPGSGDVALQFVTDKDPVYVANPGTFAAATVLVALTAV